MLLTLVLLAAFGVATGRALREQEAEGTAPHISVGASDLDRVQKALDLLGFADADLIGCTKTRKWTKKTLNNGETGSIKIGCANKISDTVTALHLSGFRTITEIPDAFVEELAQLPSLLALQISKFYDLRSLPELNALTQIKTLNLEFNYQLSTYPDFTELTQLEDLQLRYLKISYAPDLSSFTELWRVLLTNNPELPCVPRLAPGLGPFITEYIYGSYYEFRADQKAIDGGMCDELTTLQPTLAPTKPPTTEFLWKEDSDLDNVRQALDLLGFADADSIGCSVPGSGWYQEWTLYNGEAGYVRIECANDIGDTITGLYLSGFRTITEIPDAFVEELAQLPNLRTLQISSFDDLTSFPELNALTQIKTLGLVSNTQLSTYPDFTELTQLEILRLHNNRIPYAPDLSSFPELARVYLGGNSELTCVPRLALGLGPWKKNGKFQAEQKAIDGGICGGESANLFHSCEVAKTKKVCEEVLADYGCGWHKYGYDQDGIWRPSHCQTTPNPTTSPTAVAAAEQACLTKVPEEDKRLKAPSTTSKQISMCKCEEHCRKTPGAWAISWKQHKKAFHKSKCYCYAGEKPEKIGRKRFNGGDTIIF